MIGDGREVYIALGKWVRVRRKHYGLTQAQLAEQFGMERSSIANIETGRQRLLLHDFIRLHALLTTNVVQGPRMNAFTRMLIKRPDDAIRVLREIGALSQPALKDTTNAAD